MSISDGEHLTAMHTATPLHAPRGDPHYITPHAVSAYEVSSLLDTYFTFNLTTTAKDDNLRNDSLTVRRETNSL